MPMFYLGMYYFNYYRATYILCVRACVCVYNKIINRTKISRKDKRSGCCLLSIWVHSASRLWRRDSRSSHAIVWGLFPLWSVLFVVAKGEEAWCNKEGSVTVRSKSLARDSDSVGVFCGRRVWCLGYRLSFLLDRGRVCVQLVWSYLVASSTFIFGGYS